MSRPSSEGLLGRNVADPNEIEEDADENSFRTMVSLPFASSRNMLIAAKGRLTLYRSLGCTSFYDLVRLSLCASGCTDASSAMCKSAIDESGIFSDRREAAVNSSAWALTPL